MILTHEQAHTAHKIMLLALEGGATDIDIAFGRPGVSFFKNEKRQIVVNPDSWNVIGSGVPFESHTTLADFASAYDVAGTAQRIEFAKAAQNWEAFCNYHADRMQLVPCNRPTFERLSVVGRVTKMVLGPWA